MPGRRRIPGRNVAIAFDAEVLEALDETAHDLVMGRSTLVNRICRNWLEEYQIPASSNASSPRNANQEAET